MFRGSLHIPVGDDQTIEAVLDTIGDEYARQILATLGRDAHSAKELAEECNISLPTVYRRLDELDEHDLVTARTVAGDDGNEYSVYESNFESTLISLEDDEYEVRIYREQNVPDRFSQLWDDLRVE
jgi:DNA-binding HxlR family transcriptional regulator